MDKQKRQEILLKVIKANEINTQEEIMEALNQEGLKVTQATISRDIKELGLVKTGGRIKKYMYAKIAEPENQTSKFLTLLRTSVVSIEQAQNIVVIKTLSGNGSAVAAAVDAHHIEEIVGTLAGDDTVFIVAADSDSANTTVNKLKTIL